MNEEWTALVVVLKDVENDPRVRRQIDWLTDAGGTVDTLGLGDHPTPQVRRHFAMTDPEPWHLSRPGIARIYFGMSNRDKFRTLVLSRVPDELRAAIRGGAYDLIVYNDMDFAPWVDDPQDFGDANRATHVHLDLHEYFRPSYPIRSLSNVASRPYYRWMRQQIGHRRVDSRTTVSSGLARLYADEFGVEVPALVRNSPELQDLQPRPVDPKRIRLIYHGAVSWARGLREMIDAVALMDERFELTLMINGMPDLVKEVTAYAATAGERVVVVPPVPMRQVSSAINVYDAEVMFFPPSTQNLRYVLPNKMFEAIQGRLALVIGPSPMMQELIEQWGNGVESEDWSTEALARVVNALSAEQIGAMKKQSHAAAAEINAASEGRAFLAAVAPGR